MVIVSADINSIQKSVKGLEILTKGVGFSCSALFRLPSWKLIYPTFLKQN